MQQWVVASLFYAAALILFGFGLALAFEGTAIGTGQEPTISEITSGAIKNHWVYALLAAVAFGLLLGALATHFTNWRP